MWSQRLIAVGLYSLKAVATKPLRRPRLWRSRQSRACVDDDLWDFVQVEPGRRPPAPECVPGFRLTVAELPVPLQGDVIGLRRIRRVPDVCAQHPGQLIGPVALDVHFVE